MITQSDEYFAANWTLCLYVVEEAKLAMGDKDPCDDLWEKELMDKWIVKPVSEPEPEQEPDPEAEPPTEEEVKALEDLKKEKEEAEASEEADRLMGKYEKWSDIRKLLWEYYCPDDKIRHAHERPHCPNPWESDCSDEE